MELNSGLTHCCQCYLSLLLLWIQFIGNSHCHDNEDAKGLSTGKSSNLYFTYADVATSVVKVKEPDNSTLEYHVWKAGVTRNCVVNISSIELEKVVKVSEFKQ